MPKASAVLVPESEWQVREMMGLELFCGETCCHPHNLPHEVEFNRSGHGWRLGLRRLHCLHHQQQNNGCYRSLAQIHTSAHHHISDRHHR
jgi:hypothetical protein